MNKGQIIEKYNLRKVTEVVFYEADYRGFATNEIITEDLRCDNLFHADDVRIDKLVKDYEVYYNSEFNHKCANILFVSYKNKVGEKYWNQKYLSAIYFNEKLKYIEIL
jgi:hypothetical protein